MTLIELKQLMGIAESDTSQDAILSLYLETAIEAAKAYADQYDWTTNGPLPGPIRLGILEWVEIAKQQKMRQGVQSESMAGMSQTFVTSANDSGLYASVYRFWDRYHTKPNKLVFRTAKKAYREIGYE